MKTINTLVLIIFSAVFAATFAGCGPFMGVHGSGVSASEERQLATFDALDNESVVSIYLRVGQADDAVLVCDDNLLEHIKTTVEAGTLVVRDGEPSDHVDLYPKTECTLEVSAEQLKRVELDSSGSINLQGRLAQIDTVVINGSGSLTTTSIDVDALKISHNSSGSATVKGEVGELKIDKNGSGLLHAKELRASDVNLTQNSSGKTVVFASDSVYSRNNGSGSVVIAGNPSDRDVRDIGSGHTLFE